MRYLLVKIALLLILLVPSSVNAQDTVHLATVSVDIWPEYDQAAVLVIERVTLASNTSFPVTLSLRIPAGGQINAVASIDSAGVLVNAPYNSKLNGSWSILTITTSSPNIQVEYYEALIRDNITRHIEFEWPGDYQADVMQVNFLLPPGSDHLAIDPPAVSHAPGQGGLENYVIRTENLAPGKPFLVKIDYQRKSDELSISNLPVEAVTAPGPSTPGRVDMSAVLPWILAGIGGVLVIGGVIGFMVWRRGNPVPASSKQRHSRKTMDTQETIYCHECGKRAQPGDIFCRTCGTRLRQPS